MSKPAQSRITTKKAEEKLAHTRLSVLQLAEVLGNVSKAAVMQVWTAPASMNGNDAFKLMVLQA